MTPAMSTGGHADPKARSFDLIAADRGNQAIPLLEGWLRQAPQDAVAWQLLANARRNEQDGEGAHHAFQRFAALRPADPKACVGLAMAALESGRPAARLFGQLIAQGHGTPDIILSGVAALTAEGEIGIAEQLLERALAERPDWLSGHDTLSSLRWRYGDAERFDASFEAAVGRVALPFLWSAWINRLTQAERFDAALGALHKARALFGERPEFDAIEASIAIATGDPTRAEVLFRSASGLDDMGTRIAYLRHCIRLKNLDRAQDLIHPLLTGPDAGTVWPYQSIVWRLQGDDRAKWLDGGSPFHRTMPLGLAANDLAMVANLLGTREGQHRYPLDQSPRGGTQTEGNLLSHHAPCIRNLRKAIVQAVRDYAHDLPVVAGHPFLGTPRSDVRFSGSWSITLRGGGYHTCHTHPKGWMSGVLYLEVPSQDERGDSEKGSLELGRPPEDLATGLPRYCRIEPREGYIILFPSTMWHSTIPFDKGTRLTVAFDVMPPRF